jgi:hypothetical protein
LYLYTQFDTLGNTLQYLVLDCTAATCLLITLSSMIARTLAVYAKRITIPRLSPTHTKSRITEFFVKQGDYVEPYDTIFVVECSPDFITEGFREFPDQQVSMIVENQEEGVIQELRTDLLGKWVDVDTHIGIVDDGDGEIDGDWTWQAYKHTST